jgi:WD40 repeat protein
VNVRQDLAAAAWYDGSIDVWRLSTGEFLQSIRADGLESGTQVSQMMSLAFRPDGEQLAAADEQGKLSLWEVPAFDTPSTFEGPPQIRVLAGLSFSPDGKHLAHVGASQRFLIRESERGTMWRTIEGHSRGEGGFFSVSQVAYCPDGRMLATCGDDLTVRVWRVSPAGDYQAAAVISLIDLKSRRASADSATGLLPEVDHTFDPTGLAFSADGQQLAVASSQILIFDLAKLERRMSMDPNELLRRTEQRMGIHADRSPATPRRIHRLVPVDE